LGRGQVRIQLSDHHHLTRIVIYRRRLDGGLILADA